jgi:hypothetical protein
VLLCAQGLCNMSVQPGRYSLQVSLTDDTHLNRYTVPLVWLAYHAAVCCYLPVVVFLLHAQGLCNMSCSQAGTAWSFDRLDTSEQMHRCLVCPCISCRSCRSYSAVCCYLPVVVFLLHAVLCNMSIQPGEGCKGCSSVPITNHARICILAMPALMCS